MRAWIQLDEYEGPFLAAIRGAGHRRTHSAQTADFLVTLEDLVDAATGALLRGFDRVEQPEGFRHRPRFEIQVLDEPVHRKDVGTISVVWRTVDAVGRPSSIGFGVDPSGFEDEFSAFLLSVGDSVPPDAVSDVSELPELVEEFITLWILGRDEILLAAEDARVADALVAMLGELVKVTDPPVPILRESFDWLATKLDVFAEHFAASAGTTLGPVAALGVSGQLPRVVQAVEVVLRNL